jgi:hypothetical protein
MNRMLIKHIMQQSSCTHVDKAKEAIGKPHMLAAEALRVAPVMLSLFAGSLALAVRS